MTSRPRGAATALLIAAVLGAGGCAEDDGELINPRPVPVSSTPTPTPTPGEDLNP